MELILGEVFPIEHVDLPASHDSLLECTYASTHYTSSTAQGGGGSFKNRKRIGEIDCCE